MRHLFLVITFLFCSASLFGQETNDSNQHDTLKTKKTSFETLHLCFEGDSINTFVKWRCKLIIHCFTSFVRIEPISPYNIIHQNHSEFGLPTYPFRFENVNQMANTVAGVLSLDGETPSILGASREGTAYYINEVRVLEGFLPQSIEN